MLTPTEQTRAILLITSSPTPDASLAEALAAHGVVEVASDTDDAIHHLRARRFDYVISPPADFLPLSRAVGQLRAETILEKIGQGVCIVDRDGRMIWANAKLRSYPPSAVERVREACTRLCQEFAAEKPKPDTARNRRRSLNVDDDYHFDLTASALLNPDEQVAQVVTLVWDVTATRRLQEKIDAIDAAGAAVVKLDAETVANLDVVERLALIEDKIIRYSRELMHFDHFAVRVLDKKTNRLETVLASGMSEEAKSLEILASPEGNGISGYVAATGRSYICPDVMKDPRFLPGLENARSSLTVPLRLHDQVVGILNVESDSPAAFSEDDRQIAEIFGRYIAMALNMLNLMVVERCATTGQITADVAHELAAPLNDIVTQVSTIIEDYIGHDDLRKRLHVIIDGVDRVKRTIQTMKETPAVVGLGSSPVPTADPLLDGKRILIADDEDIIRETVADVLTKAGALTVMAKDGEEAVTLLGSQTFDLVLSDIKMPNRNGYEVFAAARKASVPTAVVLITGFGYDPEHSIVRASKEGLAGVLFKPFKVEQLLDEVRRALTPKTP